MTVRKILTLLFVFLITLSAPSPASAEDYSAGSGVDGSNGQEGGSKGEGGNDVAEDLEALFLIEEDFSAKTGSGGQGGDGGRDEDGEGWRR